MSLVVDNVRADVASIGELGDEVVAEVAERIADLVGRSLPARVLEFLSEVAAEVSAELPEGRVEIRVAGDDVGLTYLEDTPVAGGDADASDLSARITLRLSEGLKTRVEEGAGRDGVSVNTFIVRTLERSASTNRYRTSRGGNRLRGYGTT